MTFAATLNVCPIFEGGRVKSDVLRSDAALRKKQAELEDLKGKIDQEVRFAFLDLRSAGDLAKVAKSNMTLANDTLARPGTAFRRE